MKHLILFSALLLAGSFTLSACSGKGSSSDSSFSSKNSLKPLPDRDPTLAYQLFQKGGLLIDVRTPQEYEEGHLEGSRLIPIGELSSRIDEVNQLTGGDKNKPIIVHCRAGGRAALAKDTLMKAGFTQVTNLGNMADWPGKKN